MALEVEKKEKKHQFPIDILILIFFLILFLGFLGSYFYFLFFENKLKKEISETESSINKIKNEIEPLEKKAFQYEEKIKNFKTLLGFYKKPLNFFDFLEENTHPQVWFNSLELNLTSNQLKIPGFAKSFEVLSQQILIFKNNEFVKNINLLNINLGKEGGVNFGLELILDPKIYK